jgi:hypothetical protein
VVPAVGAGGGGSGRWCTANAGAEVGRKHTAAGGAAGAGAATDGVGKWGHGGTPSGTWEEHCWTELSQPSSSLLPCGCKLPHPQ